VVDGMIVAAPSGTLVRGDGMPRQDAKGGAATQAHENVHLGRGHGWDD
jgi:hypothetical protein